VSREESSKLDERAPDHADCREGFVAEERA
jgi:hypothetical protein